MTPWARYQQALLHEDICFDPAQAAAVRHTQTLYDKLPASKANEKGFWRKIKQHLRPNSRFIPGLYLWGGVGRGKTYIINCFYDSLPFKEKQRTHFHRFMRQINAQLKQLKNITNPLEKVADNITAETSVLCLDEFHVSDITDAMLLSGLLKALFARNLVLVTTSNEGPDQLYQDGLQRKRFLPAIALIKHYTEVVHIDAGTDYRLRYLDKAEIYHAPLDEKAHAILATNFEHIAPNQETEASPLFIEGREIAAIRRADGVIWFDFQIICGPPRGPADYTEIARMFQTLLISDIPAMTDQDNDQAKRFMILVDELYNHNTKLIVTAATQPENLYSGERLAKPFRRTISRLEEMRTHDYLAKQHLP